MLLDEVQRQIRIAPAELRQHFGQHEGGNRRNDPEPEFAGQRLVLTAGQLDERLNILQAQACLRCDLLADGGDRNVAVRAVDELGVEQGLEFADGVGECGLRHERRFGGTAEMAVLGEGDKVAQLLR